VIGKWKKSGKNLFILVILSAVSMFFSGCASGNSAYTPRKHMKYYRGTNSPSVQRADDIQYRSAYKYDLKGKKYKKHFKQRKKRKRDL
jgi:hypothetical protein